MSDGLIRHTGRVSAFDWNQARSFLAVADHGTLMAAARVLQLSQPTLSRHLVALERQLGVPLFARHGRGMALTPGGQALLAHVRVMEGAARQVALTAQARTESLDGSVTLSVSEVMAAYVMPGILQALRASHPRLSLSVIAANRPSDLLRREADIAIRLFQPTQGHLIARRVGQIALRLYATPGYLDQLGRPTSLDALAHATFIVGEDPRRYVEPLRQHGLTVTDDNLRIRSASRVAQWELTKQGLGIGLMQEDIGDAEPRVVRAVPALPPDWRSVWLAAHEELRTHRAVRAVFDHLASLRWGSALAP
ncbi:LysR family transcriptional regulator [Ideonella sp.]|uniref:LysR family transcriptional regulator n=1 Tax=Ideonella sp. TaxID=1929293 RepID=UPI0035AE3AB4